MKLEDIETSSLSQPEYQTLSPSASEPDCDGDELSEYKLQLIERIKRNREVFFSLGLDSSEDPKRKKM